MGNVDKFFCSFLNVMLAAALRISEDQCRLVVSIFLQFLFGFPCLKTI